jgi:hypothetical protein
LPALRCDLASAAGGPRSRWRSHVVRDNRCGRSGGRHRIRADRQRSTADHRHRDVQGQAAAVTIAQTTVTTVAQAAAVSGAGGASGGASAGAGAGGGGGLSTTTIGVIAGAVAGGAILAKELVFQSGVTYKGNYSGSVNTVFPPSLSFCSRTIAHSGTVEIDIEVGSDGGVTGEGGVNGTTTMTSFSGPNICAITTATQTHGCCTPHTQVQGTTSSFTFSGGFTNNGITATYDFVGSLNGDVGTGTLTLTFSGGGELNRGLFPVTLQKQ